MYVYLYSADTTKIFDYAQFYRIFVCNLTFASMGELIFGLLALCPLMRRFEREVSIVPYAIFRSESLIFL